jgi:hypothetical protein
MSFNHTYTYLPGAGQGGAAVRIDAEKLSYELRSHMYRWYVYYRACMDNRCNIEVIWMIGVL